jgi:beta-glucosidase
MTQEQPTYLNTELTITERVDDLISRLSLEQKISQMMHPALAVEPLGIPEYNWWNEALHGVARAGIATVFPQAIGLAATWNVPLLERIATAISDEARAKHHEFIRNGVHDIYTGLTMWSPNINIFRDPRWGRGQETYGEDPYLTSRLGVAFVRGLQGDDQKYLKCVATPKHYAVHSGPEADRHGFDARVSERDLRETYLPAFEACVKEAKAASVMTAYNRVNGEACSASHTLMQDILRDEWGFDGYIVSDCGAVDDVYRHHHVVDTPEAAAALAVKNGCDLNCGDTYGALARAVEQGLISEAEIDTAVRRLFTARFRLGMFDPPEQVAYAQTPFSANDSPEHRALAREVARQSIVLLKNAEECLPLRKDIKSLAVIGPLADDHKVLLGNYNGTPSQDVTVLEGIKNRLNNGEVFWAKGCEATGDDKSGFIEAAATAKQADLAVVVLGLTSQIEGEEGDAPDSDAAGDRTHIDLPGVQEELLKAIVATGKPVVLVLMGGSALAINWAEAHVPAILMAWYPGEEGGAAVADVLFGDYNPAGRLPVTFYKSLAQLPDFCDYNMTGRTYRFFAGEPLYPFGYGLSYTSFKYSNLQITPAQATIQDEIDVRVVVENIGARAGDEVVQMYVSDVEACVPRPIRELRGTARIHLHPNEKQTVRFTLKPQDLSLINDAGQRVVEPGEFLIAVGGGQPDSKGTSDENVVMGRLEVKS